MYTTLYKDMSSIALQQHHSKHFAHREECDKNIQQISIANNQSKGPPKVRSWPAALPRNANLFDPGGYHSSLVAHDQHCTMCDFHNFGLIFAGQCTVCLNRSEKKFQAMLILVFEVIVQSHGHILWHFQVRPKSWKSHIVHSLLSFTAAVSCCHCQWCCWSNSISNKRLWFGFFFQFCGWIHQKINLNAMCCWRSSFDSLECYAKHLTILRTIGLVLTVKIKCVMLKKKWIFISYLPLYRLVCTTNYKTNERISTFKLGLWPTTT